MGERESRRERKIFLKRLVCLKNRAGVLFFTILIFVYILGCLNSGCMQKFCKGEGGGANLEYFKKTGAQLQAVSGGALEDNVKN